MARLAQLKNLTDAQESIMQNGYTCHNQTMEITLTELEDAINYWRTLRPSSGEECSLSPEVNALATSYALMIFHGLKSIPLEQLDAVCVDLIKTWREKP